MKKVVATVILGCALLATCGIASAEQIREAEPRWELRSEKSAATSPLDFARWLARRLNEGMAIPVPLPAVPSPKSAPVTEPGPNDGEVICPPERIHCPVG